MVGKRPDQGEPAGRRSNEREKAPFLDIAIYCLRVA
jgi:hypothetical protein